MKRLFAVLALLLVLVTPAAAQDDDVHPLLDMLALVPDVPASFENVPVIGYIDFNAFQQSRPGVGDYASGADYAAAHAAQEDGVGLWIANSARFIFGPTHIVNATLRGGAETRELLGFDLFDVDHVLMFGAPPATAMILRGDFDSAAIIAAYETRGYAVTQHEGLVTLARADGQPGTTIDANERNPANPFGGEFGRKEPLILAGDLILNSASDDVIEMFVGTLSGTQRDIASRPSIVAAAEAVTAGEGLLVQAAFLDPRHVAVTPAGAFVLEQMLEATPDVEAIQAALKPELPSGYGALPFYTIAVMADRTIGDDQVAMLALVYDDEATAQAAAEELTTRLSLFRDTVARRDEQPLLDMVEGARMAEPEVYFSESTGKFVAVASVLYPTPDNTPIDRITGEPLEPGAEGGSFVVSGRVIRYWLNSIYSRAFDVLYVTE